MKPRGPLMVEHRLIEKALALAGKIPESIRSEGKADIYAVYTVVDFIKTYADRTHHGKEEDILFRELGKKQLSGRHKSMMQELIEEHRTARQKTAGILEAVRAYESGDTAQLETIAVNIDFLAGFYPAHIAKEDDIFFPETENYFSAAEMDGMLVEFREFDSAMIHEKYGKVYELLKERT
jgi:hemerythrin-like domain-containing protein